MYEKELIGALEHLTGLGYNVAFLSLYGSQNYNMSTELIAHWCKEKKLKGITVKDVNDWLKSIKTT